MYSLSVIWLCALIVGIYCGSQDLKSGGNATLLDSAASAGGYYYDKLRYRSEYSPYSSYEGYKRPEGYREPEYGYNGYATESCYGKPPGLFGNAAYDCKSFSICQSDGRLDTMDCPAYTRFNNYLAVCDWPYKVDAYCNPVYKDEYEKPKYEYEKPKYEYEKPKYEYEKPKYEPEKPKYEYEKPKYEKPYYAPEGKVYEKPEPYEKRYSAPNYYSSKSYGYEYPQSYGYKGYYPSYGYGGAGYPKKL